MISGEQIRVQLGRILASSAFEHADRASAFLRFVVTTSLEGHSAEIKESVIAVEALARNPSFDPKADPIVRVEAGRLRNRLKTYYDSEGANDPVLITLPRGSYVPEFSGKTQLASSNAVLRNPIVLAAAGLLAACALAALAVTLIRKPAPPGEVLQLSLLPPPGSTIQSSSISPDGKHVALTLMQQNRTALWIRPLGSPEARLAAGTEGAILPFWAPDSRSLAFFVTDKLRRVELTGGPPQEICAASIPLGGGTWSANGVIVFSPRPEGALYKVSATGGQPQPATKLDRSRGEVIHRFPEFLPDGRHFLYLAISHQPAGTALRLGSIDSLESGILLEGSGNASYAQPESGNIGSLLFYFRGALMAQPFDANHLTFRGEQAIVSPQVLHRHGRADFSVSANQILAYQSGNRKKFQLAWFDRAGRLIENVGAENDYVGIRLSPDEKRLAFGDEQETTGYTPVWVMEFSQGLVSRVSSSHPASFMPIWTPDGKELLYSSGSEQGMRLLRQPLNAAHANTLLDTPGPKFLTDWSADGQFVTYFTPWPEFLRLKTVVVNLRNRASEKDAPRPFLESQYNEAEAVFSPDASSSGPRWIAYTSTETGRSEVYVRSFPKGDRKWPISNGGAWQPQWRSDGRELFFLSQDGILMAVAIGPGSEFKAGAPHPLFRTTIPPYSGPPQVPARSYAVGHRGLRFLVNQAPNDSPPSGVSIVTRWRAAKPLTP